MKKLSCFALVVALVLAAGAAFALPTTDANKLAPYDTTKDYDLFTLSADKVSWDLVSTNLFGMAGAHYAANKSIMSADIAGLSFYILSSDKDLFYVGAYQTTPTASTISDDPDVSDDWYGLLLRTTANTAVDGALEVPIKVFVSQDLNLYTFGLLSGDLIKGTGLNLVCEYDCCGVEFDIDCCAPNVYSTIKSHSLTINLDDPTRVAVYCCPGVPFAVVASNDANPLLVSYDVMKVPFTVARLNDDLNMVRVRIDTNFRDNQYATNSYWSWFEILEDGQYAADDVCYGTTETFWPWKQELVCTEYGTASLDRYYWKGWKDTGAETPVAYGYDGKAAFWKTKDHMELSDVRLGETLNLGVWYGGAVSSDSHLCVCVDTDPCNIEQNNWVLPRINIQNLGTARLDITGCADDPEKWGICAADCGLCDTLSFDVYKAAAHTQLGYVDSTDKDPSFSDSNIDFTKYNGIYGLASLDQTEYVTAAFRWGDFYHFESKTEDIITVHCPCYIYPAFTKTIQPMANADFSFTMHDNGDSTVVKGRWNTSYIMDKLYSDNSSLCSPNCAFLYVYYPCGCEATRVTTTLEKNQTGLIGKVFVNEVENDAQGKLGDVKLDGARNVTNPASEDIAQCIAFKAAVKDALWYNFFKVVEWDWSKNEALSTPNVQGILPVQLRFELAYDKISGDIDLDVANWRTQLWSDGTNGKFTLFAYDANGNKTDILNSLSTGTGAFNGKDILDKLSFVTVVANDELKRETTGTKHVAWTKLNVYLTVFVVDGTAPDGKTFHYYKNDETGNYFLFVFDGKDDGIYENILYVAKPSATCTFNVTGTTSFLVGESTTLTANCLGTCTDILWTLSSDVAEISGDKDKATVVVKGLKAGTDTIHVDACTNSKDVVLTVTTPTPTVTPTTAPSSSSGGGCNAGAFAPLALLLITPVVFLLKK